VRTASIIRAIIAPMMEAVRTSESSVNFNVTIWGYIPDDSKLNNFVFQIFPFFFLKCLLGSRLTSLELSLFTSWALQPLQSSRFLLSTNSEHSSSVMDPVHRHYIYAYIIHILFLCNKYTHFYIVLNIKIMYFTALICL
jgi:hypothetical protein